MIGVCRPSSSLTKPVFGVSDKVRLKPVSSATETSQKIEVSPTCIERLEMILSKKRIAKTLKQLTVGIN